MSVERKPFFPSLNQGPKFLSPRFIEHSNGSKLATTLPANLATDKGDVELGAQAKLNSNQTGSGFIEAEPIFPVPQD